MAKIAFTAGRISGFKCATGKAQSFLWDATAPGLGVRATPAGKPAYVFQGEFEGQSIRITIGSPDAWSISQAQERAREMQRQIDKGHDPRDLKRGVIAAAAQKKTAAVAEAVTVGDLWQRYLVEGKPKRKAAFKPRYRADLEAMGARGGEKKKRGTGNTRPGPLYPLMALRLCDANEDSLKSWYDSEAKLGAHQAARALMMFRGFMRWTSAQRAYRALIDRDAGKAAAIVEGLPSNTRRTDALEAAQVPGWWAGVNQLANRTASLYLRALLLTGARREEMAGLKWSDVNFQWPRLTIADKVEATRVIPLTPYLAQQLATLPRVNEYVFASTGKAGRIADPRASHKNALQTAGIEGLTIHGLRRSFSLLGEAAGAPAGAIAQVMGHKPSATAEGYRPRSVDALRPYLAQIEAHILEQAGVAFDAKLTPGGLRVVGAAA